MALLFALMLNAPFIASAELRPEPESPAAAISNQDLPQEAIVLYYRHDSSMLDSLYNNNASSYARVRAEIAQGNIDKIKIVGSASPVGNDIYNTRLSLRRAESARKLINELAAGKKLNIEVSSAGEDWAGFAANIEREYFRKDREKVLEIVRSQLSNDDKERALLRLDSDGTTYRHLVRFYMAPSRNATSIIIFHHPSPMAESIQAAPDESAVAEKSEAAAAVEPTVAGATTEPTQEVTSTELTQDATQEVTADVKRDDPARAENIVEISTTEAAKADATTTDTATTDTATTDTATTETATTDTATADTTTTETAPTEESSSRTMVAAVRSNLLVPALNVGVEVPIGNQWSVGAEYYYPWIWPAKDNRNCFELLAWNIEGRYWFGRERTTSQRLQGHAVGIYGGAGYFDVERNFAGNQGEFANVGVDYTYALSTAKGRLHFEFSLGVGYLYAKARPYYVPVPGGELLWNKEIRQIHYFGPTRLNVSIAVPIFVNHKKEGRNE